MGKIAIPLVFIGAVLAIIIGTFLVRDPNTPVSPSIRPTGGAATDTNKDIVQIPSSSVFVPYWGLTGEISGEFNRYYYFGIAGGKNGIDKEESGYRNLQVFINNVPSGKEKYLVVRMVDSEVNSAVLRDGAAQRRIIEDAITTADEYGFDGIVLDFEITALAFDSVIKEINSFLGLFGKSVKQSKYPFLITVYGDTFYRLRPYDIKTISKDVDGILIMTYDFHKARGNPGPNFPYRGRAIYGYDFKAMVEDFTKVVSKDKITVVFGLFGYDWTIDNTNKGVGTAQPLTLNQIEQKFLQKCVLKNCMVKRDNASAETSVTYTDSEDRSHIVWFEDWQSLEEKKKYLEEQGIKSISLWAYSYF